MLYGAGQIPVNRGAADAALALKQAEEALKEGAAVIIYPEGTATRDPGCGRWRPRPASPGWPSRPGRR